MAVRAYWKENSNLLLTVGGFHPAYTPPPMNLPQLARLAIVLFEGNPDVRAEAYFAVTSNTVQFGARLQLSYSLSVFNRSASSRTWRRCSRSAPAATCCFRSSCI
jgi:hypothetical protein